MGTSESDNSAGHEQPRPQDTPASREAQGLTARESAADFAEDLAAAVAQRISRSCSAKLTGLSVESLAEFYGSTQPGGAAMLLASCRSSTSPEPIELLFEIAAAPAFALIDALLGGDRGDYVPNRSANETELRLLSRVIAEPARNLLGKILPGEQAGAGEVEPAPAEPNRPAESVLVARVELTVGQSTGTARLAMPRVLFPNVATQPGDNLVQITVDTSDTNLRGGDLENLAPGDILMTDLPADSEVAVRAAGIVKFVGRLAAGNGRRAVHITGRADDQSER
ncbi:MAG: FliM/FliN family flagellar motor switch protein [Phycisphaerae bacterium]